MTINNQKKLFLFTLGCVVLIAVVSRLYKLQQYPLQLNRDEAALAINALYIKQAGVDEWNQHFPLQFKSLGDYKLPGYIYLLAGVFTFSTSDFMVRVPAALSGIALVVIAPYWANLLFEKKLKKKTALFLLLAFATDPFAIFYSRMAWEANLALALMIGALALLHQAQWSWKKDLFATVLYTCAVITYNSPFLLLPFIICTLPIKRGVKQYKTWIFPVLTLTFLLIGVFLLFSQNNVQKSGILFFNDPDVLAQYPAYRMGLPSLVRPLIGSKIAYFFELAVIHYRDTFLPGFLVIHGGQHPWHSILGRGHLYWTVYVLFFVGVISQLLLLVQLFKRKKTSIQKHLNFNRFIPLFLLVVSPLPAIFTTDAPHATRSLFTFIMIVVFSGIGFEQLCQIVSKYKNFVQYGFVSIFFFCLIIESSVYLYQYFIVWPGHFSPDFQLGFLPVLQTVTHEHPTGNIAIIDLGWYMYVIVAWYERIPAQEAIATFERSGPDLVGLYRVHHVGRYYFVYHDDEQIPDKQGLITRDRFDGHWKL